ncbi:MAG: diaminobutyrate--2-oxoglutarate transaminase [Pseudomonadales bacterium]|nr:diaminobutyrate--2-oxoglutarate transaminase [Pseudomonadales bacterium]
MTITHTETRTVSPLPVPNAFARYESGVRSYCRSFPRTFARAEGAHLFDRDDQAFLDFLCGCSTLNYGHNHPVLKRALIEYLERDGVTCGLDMFTDAKEAFLRTLNQVILKPRNMTYLAQFTGPTGTNAVEAALKLARKVTGRQNVIAFTNGFHGVSLGALAATGNGHHRMDGTLVLSGVTRMPFDGYLGPDVDTADYLDAVLEDPSSGVDKPAAILLETVQGEGGLNVAGPGWFKRVEAIARKHGALLIVDDIQAGCGRTGTFFSFEHAGIQPDLITLAKSLSGLGLPLSLVLIRPDLDVWSPGEHNGTFRGNCHAFVTATAALNHFWRDNELTARIAARGAQLRAGLAEIAIAHGLDPRQAIKGRGMMLGLSLPQEAASSATTGQLTRAAFARRLLIETSGPYDEVVKVLAPLTISGDELADGLSRLSQAAAEAFAARGGDASGTRNRAKPGAGVR